MLELSGWVRPIQSPEPAARITEEKWRFHAGLFRMNDRPVIGVDNL
jgi:hypothetical protein